MAAKRPLDQLEEMVHALPPAAAATEKKSKKERKVKIKKPPPPLLTSPPPPVTTSPPPPPPPPTVEELFNGDHFNIFNVINEPSSSYRVELPPMEEVCQPMNCPVCQTDLICFQARHTAENYIKCQNSQCGLFCHQDQLTTYLKIIDQELHPDHRKKMLVCDCEEPVVLRISQSAANPNRPYFTCQERPEDRCPFFQWADKPLKPKNKRKQRQDKS